MGWKGLEENRATYIIAIRKQEEEGAGEGDDYFQVMPPMTHLF